MVKEESWVKNSAVIFFLVLWFPVFWDSLEQLNYTREIIKLKESRRIA